MVGGRVSHVGRRHFHSVSSGWLEGECLTLRRDTFSLFLAGGWRESVQRLEETQDSCNSPWYFWAVFFFLFLLLLGNHPFDSALIQPLLFHMIFCHFSPWTEGGRQKRLFNMVFCNFVFVFLLKKESVGKTLVCNRKVVRPSRKQAGSWSALLWIVGRVVVLSERVYRSVWYLQVQVSFKGRQDTTFDQWGLQINKVVGALSSIKEPVGYDIGGTWTHPWYLCVLRQLVLKHMCSMSFSITMLLPF